MVSMRSKTLQLVVMSPVLCLSMIIAVQPASAVFVYNPTLTNSIYTMSITPADLSNHNLATYEKVNGEEQKQYYDYDYQITSGCSGASCSSSNRININKNGANVTDNFYGLTNSAVYNNNRQIGKLTGDFINNKGTRGGAIYNAENSGISATIGDIEGDFINNKSDIYGGAIVNSANVSGGTNSIVTIGNIKGNFVGNISATSGGAIYNYSNLTSNIAKIGNITGDFIANEAQNGGWGGAIYNDGIIGNITGDYIFNKAEDGGAIMNTKQMGNIIGNFYANEASGFGGALYLSNYNTIGKISGDFVGNTSVSGGGAIYNSGTKNLEISGNFVENQAKYGGAILNFSGPNDIFPTTTTINNSSFYHNSAEKLGGAVYHEGVVDIIADNYESVFQGNTANGVSNAIFVSNDTDNNKISEVNLIAQNVGSLNFYDDIDGDEGYKLNLSGDDSSQINFYANIKNGDITIGEPVISRAATTPVNVNFVDINNISNQNNSFIMNDGSVTFGNFALTNHHFRDLELNGGEVNINNVDVDLANLNMGKITGDTYLGGNTLVKVHHVNVVSDGDTYNEVDFADSSFSHQVENNISAASGPVYDYAVNYLPNTGQYTFQRAGITPAVNVPSYAAVAAVSVLSDEIYSRVLADSDIFLNNESVQKGMKPFVKVFGSDDDIDITNLPGGNSKYYGVIAGLETTPTVYESGWKSVYNAYFAYAQGEHKYADQRIDQDSSYIGVSSIIYKNNFFAGTTFNVGVMRNKSKDNGITNKFTSYLGGFGLKAGYNFDVGSDFTFQPNIYSSYTYISSNDYTTSNNAKVKFHNMSNFELAPGIKLSKKFQKGLDVYLKARYVFNFNDGQEATANGITLPDIELKNYVEVGLGFEKEWADNGIRSFVEVSRREGGRDGWNGLAGIKWDF